MKLTMKRLLAVMLAVCMFMMFAAAAFAADETEYTITVETSVKNPGSFVAYQIFTGDLDEVEGKQILSDVVWGSAVTAEDQVKAIEALNKIEEFKDCKTAAEVAEVLSGQAYDSDLAQKFADVIAPFLTVEAARTEALAVGQESVEIKVTGAGYYMIKSEAPEDATDYAATRYVLAVVGNTQVQEKADVPSVEKKVQDINDSEDDNIGDNAWEDTADHDIGDHVPFQLTGTLPTNYDKYDTYNYIFHDTLSEGLTYDEGSVKVYVKNGDTKTEIQEGFTVNCEGQTLTVTFADLKTITEAAISSSSEIIVEYTATLNENAVIGNPGNPNEVYLEYSNNPNEGGEGDTGTTPPDKVVVFTFEFDVNKTHMNGEKEESLNGAGFTLYKKDANGEYQPLYFTEHEGKYVLTDPPEGEDVNYEITGDISSFPFVGLDDGDYKLVETTVPDGYNSIDPIYFSITSDHTSDPDTLELLTVTFTPTPEEGDDRDIAISSGDGAGNGAIGVGSMNVLNQAGSQLPETGGIGTTIFYIVGSVLVIGAAVLLITKFVMKKRITDQD